jgi:hypothetical protein
VQLSDFNDALKTSMSLSLVDRIDVRKDRSDFVLPQWLVSLSLFLSWLKTFFRRDLRKRGHTKPENTLS